MERKNKKKRISLNISDTCVNINTFTIDSQGESHGGSSRSEYEVLREDVSETELELSDLWENLEERDSSSETSDMPYLTSSDEGSSSNAELVQDSDADLA